MLLRHPKVVEVSVIGVPDPRLFQEICVCIVPYSEAELSSKELEIFIAKTL